MAGVQLLIGHEREHDEIDDDGGRHEPVMERGAGEAFRAAVILRDGAQDNAPPEVAVDLDVPFVPAVSVE